MASTADVSAASAPALSRGELEDSLLSLAVEARALLGIIPSSYTPRGKVDGIDTFDVDRRKVPAHGFEDPGLGEQERDHPSHRFSVLGTGVRLYPPSALEFARVCTAHTPAVFAGVPEALFPYAWEKWDDTQYLISRMGDRKVKVAFTPNGRADDIVTLPPDSAGEEAPSTDGKVFALPFETEITFRELFAALHPPPGSDAPAAYLQSQNNNLCNPDSTEGDFSPLLEDLLRTSSDDRGARAHTSPSASMDSVTTVRRGPTPASEVAESETELRNPHLLDVPFASAVYGVPPEAVNVWFGTAVSASSLHKDHYENLMVVLRGTKVFTLIPPWENAWIEDDKVYPVYRWARRHPETSQDTAAAGTSVPTSASELHLVPEPSGPGTAPSTTPWLTVDPTLPPTSGRNRSERRYARGQRTHLVPPIRVVVRAGETLYLPAGWYHHVAQAEDVTPDPKDSCAIGLNFWYDTPLTDRWAWSNFATTLRQHADGTHSANQDKDEA